MTGEAKNTRKVKHKHFVHQLWTLTSWSDEFWSQCHQLEKVLLPVHSTGRFINRFVASPFQDSAQNVRAWERPKAWSARLGRRSLLMRAQVPHGCAVLEAPFGTRSRIERPLRWSQVGLGAWIEKRVDVAIGPRWLVKLGIPGLASRPRRWGKLGDADRVRQPRRIASGRGTLQEIRPRLLNPL